MAPKQQLSDPKNFVQDNGIVLEHLAGGHLQHERPTVQVEEWCDSSRLMEATQRFSPCKAAGENSLGVGLPCPTWAMGLKGCCSAYMPAFINGQLHLRESDAIAR